MKATGWLKGLQVTVDGTGIVSHAGVALIRALAESGARIAWSERSRCGPASAWTVMTSAPAFANASR